MKNLWALVYLFMSSFGSAEMAKTEIVNISGYDISYKIIDPDIDNSNKVWTNMESGAAFTQDLNIKSKLLFKKSSISVMNENENVLEIEITPQESAIVLWPTTKLFATRKFPDSKVRIVFELNEHGKTISKKDDTPASLL